MLLGSSKSTSFNKGNERIITAAMTLSLLTTATRREGITSYHRAVIRIFIIQNIIRCLGNYQRYYNNHRNLVAIRLTCHQSLNPLVPFGSQPVFKRAMSTTQSNIQNCFNLKHIIFVYFQKIPSSLLALRVL